MDKTAVGYAVEVRDKDLYMEPYGVVTTSLEVALATVRAKLGLELPVSQRYHLDFDLFDIGDYTVMFDPVYSDDEWYDWAWQDHAELLDPVLDRQG